MGVVIGLVVCMLCVMCLVRRRATAGQDDSQKQKPSHDKLESSAQNEGTGMKDNSAGHSTSILPRRGVSRVWNEQKGQTDMRELEGEEVQKAQEHIINAMDAHDWRAVEETLEHGILPPDDVATAERALKRQHEHYRIVAEELDEEKAAALAELLRARLELGMLNIELRMENDEEEDNVADLKHDAELLQFEMEMDWLAQTPWAVLDEDGMQEQGGKGVNGEPPDMAFGSASEYLTSVFGSQTATIYRARWGGYVEQIRGLVNTKAQELQQLTAEWAVEYTQEAQFIAELRSQWMEVNAQMESEKARWDEWKGQELGALEAALKHNAQKRAGAIQNDYDIKLQDAKEGLQKANEARALRKYIATQLDEMRVEVTQLFRLMPHHPYLMSDIVALSTSTSSCELFLPACRCTSSSYAGSSSSGSCTTQRRPRPSLGART